MEPFKEIIIAFVTLVGVLIPAILVHRREMKKMKKEKETYFQATRVLDSMLNLRIMYLIRKSAERMFSSTNADRFLILIAFNGKTDFRFVSAIHEEHEDPRNYRAVERYNHIRTDPEYKEMLKSVESNDYLEIDVDKMKDGVLKDFYEFEGVKYSHVRFLLRQSINEENDLVIFSSVASHGKPFTDRCRTIFKLTYDGIILPEIQKYLD
jgi:hypothetical protein